VKINSRHYHIAVLSAANFSRVEVARRVGISASTLGQVLAKPEVQELIKRYREEFFQNLANDIAEKIAADMPIRYDRLIELSDQEDDLRVACTATLGALNLGVPRKTVHEEERHIKITVSKEQYDYGQKVREEAKTIDVEPNP